MTMITQKKDVDFVWKDIITNEPSTLMVFHQNEKGFAPFLAGMGLVGEGEPICHIYSKLFDVPAYNTAPEPTFPEWRLYCIYLTTNQMQSAIGYEAQTYAMLDPTDVAVFDYCLPEEDPMTTTGLVVEKDVVLPSPVWTFPSLFLNFCTNTIKGCWVALGFSDRENFVDTGTANQLLKYCAKTYGLDNPSTERMEKLESLLLELEELTDVPTLDRLMNNEELGGFFDEWV